MSFISLLLKPKFVIVTSPSAEAPVLDQKYIGSHVQLCDLANFAGAAPPPAAYVGWLIAADYDAYDIGHALAKADFSGRCILISSVELPSRSLILRELSTAFDQIEFSLWDAADASTLAASLCHSLIAPRSREETSAQIDA
ncbi:MULTISPECIES: hypothetical protein [Lentibacter]|jgi:hypothetical protein|uniref:Uncharacterized protein n=1 Tax=Lentibacter algarum TaxID=576131 RepID=A0A1H3KW45_9RHOB|nr:hypothetical protein [Lentibacter algarum]MCO4777155.1 hypothetical protein [Lentibacter algarum]MCO4827604.1 hypothetical protein [Lentibacter algarum]WIF31707.1 hypothetical protein LentiSH36_01239 [Lentibacter algarum]SDY56300.1 hypothetical protein SAMN05444486_102785 [Lentibacter algarum]